MKIDDNVYFKNTQVNDILRSFMPKRNIQSYIFKDL